MNEEALHTYFPIIQNHKPMVKKYEVKVLTGGYSHIVFKVHNQVFRFPKTKESELNQHAESIFSKHFSKISPISIPILHNHKDVTSGITYQTYEYISGIPFTKEYAAGLEKNELRAIAEQIGLFLTQLHAFPTKDVMVTNQVNTASEYAKYFLDIITEDEKLINSLLTPQEWEWIERNSQVYYTLACSHPFSLKVTHSDLLPKHILIDEQTHRLNGIIDFSLKVADPACDFRYFDRYGDLFLQTVYKNYPSKDASFDERRKFHARDFLVGYLYLAIRENEWKKQKYYLKELRQYIAVHP